MTPTASTLAARPQAAARLKGVLSPVITPFKADLAPDSERFVRHCKWLLKSGCSGLAVFGTNSEANSLSVEEKLTMLAALIHAGVPGAALMPGTGHCALPATVRLTANAVKMGCAGVLMLPPFYYKGVSDEGLYRYFTEVIERVGDERLRVYLYHIPPVSQVPITLKLIERLLAKYPRIVAGAKDSSGDWANTKAMLDEFGKDGFDVFPGSEQFLLEGMRHGGAGCISATANVNPGAIDRLFRDWRSGEAERMQAAISATRKIVQKQPMIAALKSIVAHYGNDAEWRRVRPPLVELTAAQEAELIPELKAAGFAMPGLAG
ncbi:MAG: dihydrodipicolinate synthase family protein [Betaproteobacteria bacterium]|nr:dihydrodipicolinate synthase family protein [Betaproteobacteria bacterium]MDH5221596.1 dihydrodipicolinate synthase family protein [Betaproteobacteria bacterium]MDH5349845.1 dihydrodipicolinate synthase family protein [Betaproteobacteria bacterium]